MRGGSLLVAHQGREGGINESLSLAAAARPIRHLRYASLDESCGKHDCGSDVVVRIREDLWICSIT